MSETENTIPTAAADDATDLPPCDCPPPEPLKRETKQKRGKAQTVISMSSVPTTE